MSINRLLKSLAGEITPPIISRGVRSLTSRLQRLVRAGEGPPGLRPVEWYDAVFKSNTGYHEHYSKSGYYFVWAVIVDRLMRSGVRNVLDLGCGPGQFAWFLYDKGLRQYCGVDLSPRAVKLARERCPSFEFIVADVLATDVLLAREYDCLVALEFLEHVEPDLSVLQKVKPGTKFFGSVPNFPYISHVRHFTNDEEVRARYQALFSSFAVDGFRSPEGHVFYVIEATKS